MGNRFGLFLGAVGVALLTLWSAFFIVDEREQAIVLRFGEIVRVEKDPGLNFKLPFGFAGLDTVLIIEDRLLRFDLADIRVQVSGGKFYEVDAFMTYQIADPRKFREQVGASLQQAETRLRSRLDAALRQTYGRRGFEAALSEERTAMMVEVRDQMRPEAENLGINVVDVRVRRTDLTAEVSDQTFQRMSAERLAEAERIRARGQEAARRIRAAADRQVIFREHWRPARKRVLTFRPDWTGDGRPTAYVAWYIWDGEPADGTPVATTYHGAPKGASRNVSNHVYDDPDAPVQFDMDLEVAR